MRPISRITSIVAASTFAATTPFAQSIPKLKPGAWEITSTTEGSDARALQEQLANLPPQVREMMEKNLPKGPQTNVSKFCASGNDEAVVQSMQARMGVKIKCENTTMRQSGTTMTWSSQCRGTMMNDQPIRSTTEHRYSGGGDVFQHQMAVKTEGGPGGSTSNSSRNGRYLGADCKAHGAFTVAEQMEQSEGGAKARKPAPR